jgi:hypothetical protein
MKAFRPSRILLASIILAALAGCLGPRPISILPAPEPATHAAGRCGDGACMGAESLANCPADCGQTTLPTLAPPTLPASARCGDGKCRGNESAANCLADCGGGGLPSQAQPTAPRPIATTGAHGPGLVYLGVMVHLEGWDDDKNQDRFAAHAAQIRSTADLFEKYGAKLTFESKEVTDGIVRWGDNVLLEMEQRGHGIGVHADLGGSLQDNCAELAPGLRAERLQLESLGVRVRHVSGNNSHCDWVAATIEAGYSFTTGIVAYGVMSMPEANRPPEYRNCRTPAACHDVFPPELEDRLHPWRPASGSDWLRHDPNGKLVILASDGGLACAQEETTPQEEQGCTFDQADIPALTQVLDDALALSSPDQVNILYFAWSMGSPLDPELLEEWLVAVAPYVQAGRVQWKTLPEMLEAYVAWEAR